jgi:hypothetical protein
MMAFSFLAGKRMNREQHRQLSLLSLANSGDGKTINEQLARWEKES